MRAWEGVLAGLPFALVSHHATLTTSEVYQSRVVAYDDVIDFIHTAGMEHLTLLAAEPGYVAYHTDNPVIDAAGLVSPASHSVATLENPQRSASS